MGGNMAITDVNAYIKNMFDPQTAAVNAAYDASAADLNTKISNAGSVYQPAKNDAYTTAAQQQRLYNENMANMGYSGAGQMSQTLQQRARNNLQSTLGTINTSQQEYINGIASDLRNAGVTRDTALAGVAADQGSAQLDAYNTEQTRALQLYSAGIISAKQFEQMTGIAVNSGSGSGSSGSTTEATKRDDYLYFLKIGLDSDNAAELSGFTPAKRPAAVSMGQRVTAQVK